MNTLHPDLQRYRSKLRDAIETDLERKRSRRRTKARILRIGVPGCAVSLGLSLTLVLAGSQAAFAGWSPSPTPASAGQTSSADATCQAQLAAAPPIAPGVAAGGGWSEVSTDVRGPFTLETYQNGTGSATCLVGPSITVVSQDIARGRSVSVSRGVKVSGSGSGLGAVGSVSILRLSSGTINHATLTHLSSAGQGPLSFVEGQVAEGVTGVTLVLSDGEHIQASTDNGWFLAWWPGSLGTTSAEIATASGVTTQTFTLDTPPMAPPPDNATCPHAQGPSSTVDCSGGASRGGAGSTTSATLNTGNS